MRSKFITGKEWTSIARPDVDYGRQKKKSINKREESTIKRRGGENENGRKNSGQRNNWKGKGKGKKGGLRERQNKRE